jgi:hypothetical protein
MEMVAKIFALILLAISPENSYHRAAVRIPDLYSASEPKEFPGFR